MMPLRFRIGDTVYERWPTLYLCDPGHATHEELVRCNYDEAGEEHRCILLASQGLPGVGERFDFDGCEWELVKRVVKDDITGFVARRVEGRVM
jgi:hypothetical protein